MIVCENVYCTTPVRKAIAASLFTRLQVPSVVFLPHEPAAVLATSEHTAIVVDVGHVQTTVVPVRLLLPALFSLDFDVSICSV